VYQKPKCGEVYNAGGGRYSNCSILEAIELAEEITGKKMNFSYSEKNRIGDHIWWISDIRKFKNDYPEWKLTYGIKDIMLQIFESLSRLKL
jgi:CDP-paratose 2-epimerase